jgi:Homeodomain-like domain
MGRKTSRRPGGPKPQRRIRLTAPEYRELQRISRLRTAPYAVVVRAKILLRAYEYPDWSNVAIARAVGCTDRTVRKWRSRSRARPAYQEAPRPGGPRFFPLSGPRSGDRPRVHVASRLG